MGGGFGGKESRAPIIALPAALAAHRLQRPIRCMLDRDEDMMITGTRHPFLGHYKVPKWFCVVCIIAGQVDDNVF